MLSEPSVPIPTAFPAHRCAFGWWRIDLVTKLLLWPIVAVATCSCLPAHAQGTVLFQNIDAGVNAPVYMSDRVTLLSGPQFVAELMGGASADALAPIATTPFLTAGY